jgi:hypothetical protein
MAGVLAATQDQIGQSLLNCPSMASRSVGSWRLLTSVGIATIAGNALRFTEPDAHLSTADLTRPTPRHLLALAKFFGVPPVYFLPDDTTQEKQLPAEVVAALTDDKVQDLALRSAGLSDRSLRAITDMVDSARAVEGLTLAASTDATGRRLSGSVAVRPGRRAPAPATAGLT